MKVSEKRSLLPSKKNTFFSSAHVSLWILLVQQEFQNEQKSMRLITMDKMKGDQFTDGRKFDGK